MKKIVTAVILSVALGGFTVLAQEKKPTADERGHADEGRNADEK